VRVLPALLFCAGQFSGYIGHLEAFLTLTGAFLALQAVDEYRKREPPAREAVPYL
jgi:hypothetical protein